MADGADSLVALHGGVVPGTDLLPETKPALLPSVTTNVGCEAVLWRRFAPKFGVARPG